MPIPPIKERLALLEKQLNLLANDVSKLVLHVTKIERDVIWLKRLTILILTGIIGILVRILF